MEKHIKEEPEGSYCQVLRMFANSRTCPFLDESKGPRNPYCTKLEKYLSWSISGKILKECK